MLRHLSIALLLLAGACLGRNCPPIARPSLRVYIVDSVGEPVPAETVRFTEQDDGEFQPCTDEAEGTRWACGLELGGAFLVQAEVDGRLYETEAVVSENDCGIVTEIVEIEVDR